MDGRYDIHDIAEFVIVQVGTFFCVFCFSTAFFLWLESQ